MPEDDKLNNLNDTDQIFSDINQYYQPLLTENPDQPDLWFGWGMELFQINRFDEAIEKFEKAENPEDKKAALYEYWVRALANLGKHELAEEKFKEAGELISPNGLFYILWGDAVASTQNYERAIEKYKKAADFEEVKSDALLKWGNVYYNQEKYDLALEKYEEIISINPDDVEAHYNIGLSSFYSHDYGRAKESFENAVRLRPQTSLYHYWLADTLSWLADYKNAVSEYETALDFEPDKKGSYYAYRNLGFALLKLGEPEDAVKNFKKAEKLQTDDGFLYLYWGDALLDIQQPERAGEKYKKAAEFEQIKPEALLKWGNIYFDEEKYDLALEKYREIISINPDDVDALYNIGLSAYYTNDFENARKSFENAIQIDYRNSNYHNWLAHTLLTFKDFQTAIDEYSIALDFETKDEGKYYTYRNLGYAYSNLNNFEEAEDKFKQAQQILTTDGYLFSYWGDSYLNQKKFTDAIGLYDQAISIDKTDPFTYYNIGQCYYKRGQYAKAHENWEKCRKTFDDLEIKNFLDGKPEYCYQFAVLLHYIYGDLKSAQKFYEKISDKLNDLQKLDKLSLYLEIKENYNVEEENIFHWKVQTEFLDIEKNLKKELARLADLRNEKERLESHKTRSLRQTPKTRDEIAAIENDISGIDEPYIYYNLGFLYFQKGFYDEAAQYFETAYKLKNSPENIDNSQISLFSKIEIYNALGICYSRLGNHKKAITFIEKAKNEYPLDLEIQNNLASAYFQAFYDAENDYLKSRYLDLAESEFKKILITAPNNIDAIFGLGYLKIEQSDFKKQNNYEEAVKYLERALRLAPSKRASSRVTKKLKVFILYQLGYAHIKMYENSNKLLNEKLTTDAAKYFQQVLTIDKDHQPSVRAAEILKKKRNPLNPEIFLDKIAPIIISLLALVTFVLSLTSFFWKMPLQDGLTVGYFIILSFGSLVFLIAGISLPQLLKLKVGTIELEKEIKKTAPLNEDFSSITKQRSDTNFSIQGISQQINNNKKQNKSKKTEKTTQSNKLNEAAKAKTT
jgi:tetratricopeptide (TPR) repeat protein